MRRLWSTLGAVVLYVAFCSTGIHAQVNHDDPASPIRLKKIEIVAVDDLGEERLRKILPIRVGDVVTDSDFARTAKTIQAFDKGMTFAVRVDDAENGREATVRISGAGFGPAIYRQPPKLKVRVEPDYPAEVRQAHVQGRVEINILIGTDGAVHDAQPVSGPAALIEPALTAVRQWKYDPQLVNGDPTEAKLTVEVEFYLNDGTTAPPPRAPGK
jgi:TonB family protein